MRDIASVGSEKKEIRRKRKARAIVALAFELIDHGIRKFNKIRGIPHPPMRWGWIASQNKGFDAPCFDNLPPDCS